MSLTISVFGSSRPQPEDPEFQLAYNVGKELGTAGFVVCNGGYGGIMTASARGAKDAGSRTIGVTSTIFTRTVNQWIDREVKTQSMMERLLTLMELGDGYVVLKGGTGTLLELACVWEFINKGFIPEKPIVVLGSFWSGVVETLREELVWEGLGDCTKFVKQAGTPQECAALLTEMLNK
jgi:hypothetical protein